ncbi:MAG: single-stranded DNA-binding protein [Nitrososphaerota archaeon]|nr:single-stranded DNA-binding protein [Nitrososphaerota archaeon]
MYSLNRVELIGRIGRNPEMRYTAEGQAVARFSLATDRPSRAGAKAEVDWHQIGVSSDSRGSKTLHW